MNTTILKRAIEELKKESPQIQYVLGMLETLYEMGNTVQEKTDKALGNMFPEKPKLMSEAEIMDAKAKSAIEAVKRLGIIEEENKS